MSNNGRTTRSSRHKNNPNKKKRKTSSKASSLLKKGLLVAVFVLLLILVSGAGLFAYYASSAPDITDQDLYGSYSSELVDRNGNAYYTVGGEEREFAAPEEYPKVLHDAVLAIEDQRFYDHHGIDPIGIGRAGFGYLTQGQIVGGGSTITQQLVKLSVFSTLKEDQTLERKAQEAWLAVQLERELSKEQILTLYMNRVHMAGNVYGMATAAQQYYGKHVSELELHEAALLAGMPQAPNRYNPYRNPELARNRRDTVLYAMYDAGYISQDQYNQASALPITEGLVEQPEQVDEENLYLDGYITAVLEEVAEQTNYNPYTAGLKIHTNIDLELQEFMYDLAHDEQYIDADDDLQTAMTVMDPTTGEILGMVGGRNIDGHLSLNRATENTRNVASTIKPLTVYGPAIEFNQRSTYEQVVDEKYTVDGTDWTPRNWDGEFLGQMSTRDALVHSRNIPAVKIFNENLNHDDVNGFLEGLGIDPAALTGSDGVVPSSAIDGSMTPLQLTGAFAAFANGGNYTKPYTVTEIETQSGEVIDARPETTKAMEDYTAYMVTDMLKGVIDLYGSQLEIPGFNHAGKTGTSNYSREQHQEHNIPTDQGLVPDSWFVGYSPEYTMSVWVGYDNHLEEGNQLSNANGKRQLPRHFYREVMSRLAENSQGPDWEMPDSVSEVTVVNGSNPARLPSPGTPSSQLITELFVEGHEPDSSTIPQESLIEGDEEEPEEDDQEDEETDEEESEEEIEENLEPEVTEEPDSDSEEDVEEENQETQPTPTEPNRPRPQQPQRPNNPGQSGPTEQPEESNSDEQENNSSRPGQGTNNNNTSSTEDEGQSNPTEDSEETTEPTENDSRRRRSRPDDQTDGE